MNGEDIDVYAGRFAGSFDLSDTDGASLGHDSEVTMTVKGIVKKVTLEDTRSGDLRLFFVIRPQSAWVHRPVQPDDEEREDIRDEALGYVAPSPPPLDDDEEAADAFLEAERPAPNEPDDSPLVGTRVSQVQERSNVAGSSQAERDKTLADFLYGDDK